MNISASDRQILRDLAKKQVELAASERNQKLYREWMKHGAFASDSRPMIRMELGTFQDDIIPPLMRCEGEDARRIEHMLLSNMANFELFEDDTLVPAYINIPMHGHFLPFGLKEKRTVASNGVAYHFDPYLTDLEDDFDVLGPSEYGFDPEPHAKRLAEMQDLLGDVIPVKRGGASMYCVPTQNIVHLMHMDDMFCAMFDYPELFHKMMDMLTTDYVNYFKMLEEKGVYKAAARDEHLGQGSYCFTEDLPAEGEGIPMNKVWLYMDSQETSGVSPKMYREFALPYYKKISSMFGLLSYGCCEAVHEIWDDGLDQFENLRKVSISAWCNQQFMGERLAGKKIVYLRKPTPNFLGVGTTLDEEGVHAHFAETVQAAKGCTLEIACRDVYCNNITPAKVHRYIEIAREELAKHQK